MKLARGLLPLIIILSAAFVGTAVHAATPTPTATPSDIATPTPTMTPAAGTPTPGPTFIPVAGTPDLSNTMRLWGEVWVNAAPAFATVQAFVGSTECTRSDTLRVGDTTSYSFAVPPASLVPGCGTPGATVTFVVGGTKVDKTVVWEPRGAVEVDLIVGPPFARYWGSFTYVGKLPPDLTVQVLIDGVVCGGQLNPLVGEGPTYDFDVVVLPAELRGGCGRPGSTLTFQLVATNSTTRARSVVATAPERIPWQIWDVSQKQPPVAQLNLVYQVNLPPAGSGMVTGGSHGLWLGSVLALLVGLGLTSAGVWLRLRERSEWKNRRDDEAAS